MSSKVEVWNMALGHLGQEEEVQDPDEDTSYANMCRRYWDTALLEEQEGFNYPYFRVQKTLAEIEEDPNDEWSFSFEFPDDCGKPLRILSGDRTDTTDSRIPFLIANNRDGTKIIYTDQEDAVLEYILKETISTIYPASFATMMSYKLAYLIAPKLTAGNPDGPALRAQVYDLYQRALSKAKEFAANLERPDPEPESEFTRNR